MKILQTILPKRPFVWRGVFLLFLISFTMTYAQKKTKIRLAEIEVFPEFLEQYLEKAKSVGAISMEKEAGVICLFPLQIVENPTQIRVVEIYKDENAYQNHIKTPHFLAYKTETLAMVKSLKLIEMNVLNEKEMSVIFKKLTQ